MPENRQVQSNGSDNLEDTMWRLKIQNQDVPDGGGGGGGAGNSSPYPDRPGEPDCIYYLRTGLCGYGSNCRFNHPPYSGQVAQYRGELPERAGQPDCQFFLKTGTCRFGSTCKYNHPRERQIAGQVPLNILGLPMRQEEKPCPYYMRNWSCKFGVACKFHHPQPLGAVVPASGPAAYGSTSSSVAPPSGLPYGGGLPAWSLPRAPYISGARMQGSQAYMPVVISSSQGIMQAPQGWNTYTGAMSQVSSSSGLGSNLVYNSKNQGELGSSRQVPLLPTSVPLFPERPDQPECQYYMKNGSCKFGSTCKYHHPKERIAPLAAGTLGPYGLPLRPGEAVCTFYSMYGICKFGSTCKFDHPLAGYYNYGVGVNVPTLTMPETAAYPYQRNSTLSHSSETSPSKSSRLPDQIRNPEATSPQNQNLDVVDSEDNSPPQASPTSLEASQAD
ncbi:hypothetical protein AQUCO_02800039v1 [Aquilegia coerulea]|uniref:C3H1-type domain-containing protein n=1 Tax=Aquilegia coerulea TaxID=218851 RepID=A0A2G5D3M0_AQUCA|nr:hypothetical protein AQUCO_02800039v1 [Aquilegia coerulea]